MATKKNDPDAAAPVEQPADSTPAPEPGPLYGVRLAGDVHAAQLHVDGAEIELTAENPFFQTSNLRLHRELLQLPFLEEAV